jgi:hypothetical protein
VEAPRIFERTVVDELARELLFSLPKRADARNDMAQSAGVANPIFRTIFALNYDTTITVFFQTSWF